MKARGEKVVCVTAYDTPTAQMADAAGVDVVLVGDSVGNVVLGYESTAAACGDGRDNDCDGFVDCADNTCSCVGACPSRLAGCAGILRISCWKRHSGACPLASGTPARYAAASALGIPEYFSVIAILRARMRQRWPSSNPPATRF